MQCKQCGHENDRLIYEPVSPPFPVALAKDEAQVKEVFYKRWACEKCGRYHFPDGSLYTNPFKEMAL